MLPAIHTPIPGPRSLALAARLRQHESRNVTFLAEDWPIFWHRAEGTNVWDADGNRFLDLTSAFGVAGLGHTRAEVRDALTAQATTLLHAMGDVHPTELKVQLCEQLSALTFERWGLGAGKVILGNSGFESIEAALKTAHLATGKAGVIAFHGGYHGLGFGALAVGGIPFFREPFRAQLADFATLLPYPTGTLGTLHSQLEKAIAERPIGAILVEPIQGRGGCVVPPPDFLPLLRRVCDEHKILLIADEILTGFNRTGALFASEHTRTTPDLICLGKGLTSGFPLSACVGRASTMDAWPPSTGEALHTSTFLGNPLGCAMSLASLALHSQPTLAHHVRQRGEKMTSALREIPSPHIGEIRGTGLMLGATIVHPDGTPDGTRAIALVQNALRHGLLLLADSPTAHVLSFTPAFTITDKEIAHTATWLREALAAEG